MMNSYGRSPLEKISHIATPKLHTSVASVYTESRIDSGAIHRTVQGVRVRVLVHGRWGNAG